MDKLPYINIHFHDKAKEEGALQIRSLTPAEYRSMQHPPAFCSVGLHPWFSDEKKWEAEIAWMEKNLQHDEILAIGECGLDKLRGPAIDLQKTIFERQVALSEKVEKPMILHLVKALDELLEVRNQCDPKQTWIVHGFNLHPQSAAQLTAKGMQLSFGKHLFVKDSQATASLRVQPRDTFFFETDDSDVSIAEIYRAAAEILACPIEELIKQQYEHFKQTFPVCKI